jgi:hypothetical protein
MFTELKRFSSKAALVVLLSGCATPHVVKSVQTADTALTCRQLETEMADADRFREAANKEKGMSGTNIVAALFFWPAILGTYSNANEAMAAADTRKAHLTGIHLQKKCTEKESTAMPVAIAAPISKSSDQKLVELKSFFEKNLITKEEYDAKRAKIIGEM